MLNIKGTKVFLGGSCDSSYRNFIVPLLEYHSIDYFNPVVDDWNEEAIKKENNEKDNTCDIHLYCITPKIKGVYSIMELINSIRANKIVIFIIVKNEAGAFTKEMLHSLLAIRNHLQVNENPNRVFTYVCDNLQDLLDIDITSS